MSRVERKNRFCEVNPNRVLSGELKTTPILRGNSVPYSTCFPFGKISNDPLEAEEVEEISFLNQWLPREMNCNL
jgi:hypothetical protein